MRAVVPAVALVLGVTSITAPAAASPTAASGPLTAQDVAVPAGIYAVVNDMYGTNVVADFNGDGISDLYLGQHQVGPGDVYYGNPDGTFTLHQSLPAGVDRHGCTAGDFNGDGFQDIFCAVGADHGTSASKSDELWLGSADGTFTVAPGAGGAVDASGRGRVAMAVDVNGDGADDLWLGNAFPLDYPSNNALYLSTPGSTPLFALDANVKPKPFSDGVCATHSDMNGDGFQDIYTCGRPDHLLLGDGHGGMTDRSTAWIGTSTARGVAKSSVGVAAGDLNGDGRTDLVTVATTQLTVWLNTGSRLVQSYTRPLLAGCSVALADVDGNGSLDIYVVQGRKTQGAKAPNQPDYLMMNDGTGLHYTDFPGLPEATSGSGSNVAVIPQYGTTGHPAFVVTNGAGIVGYVGPRQLIAFSSPS